MNLKEKILEKHLMAMQNTIGVKLPKSSEEFILRAMTEYANIVVNLRETQLKTATAKIFYPMLWGLFKINVESFILRVRAYNLKKKIRSTQRLSNLDKRKYYIIRKNNTKYEVLSTSDIDFNKKVRILDKDVDAKLLHEKADCVIYPKKKNV